MTTVSKKEKLLSLHRYYIWANKMRDHFDSTLMTSVTKDGSNGMDAFMYMGYWYGTIYAVAEGWIELGLKDDAINTLLKSDNLGLLKRYHRQKLLKSPIGKINEIVAKKAGDKQELWFISSKAVSIAGMTLQQLTPQGWVDRADFKNQGGIVVVADAGKADISKIVTDSYLQRIKMGMPVLEFPIAA